MPGCETATRARFAEQSQSSRDCLSQRPKQPVSCGRCTRGLNHAGPDTPPVTMPGTIRSRSIRQRAAAGLCIIGTHTCAEPIKPSMVASILESASRCKSVKKKGIAAVMVLVLSSRVAPVGHEGADCNRPEPDLVAFRPTITFPVRHNQASGPLRILCCGGKAPAEATYRLRRRSLRHIVERSCGALPTERKCQRERNV